jgi:hypothetical protein
VEVALDVGHQRTPGVDEAERELEWQSRDEDASQVPAGGGGFRELLQLALELNRPALVNALTGTVCAGTDAG